MHPKREVSHPGLLCRWCAPYGYKERDGLGCGGANRWIFSRPNSMNFKALRLLACLIRRCWLYLGACFCRWEVVPLGAFPGWLTWTEGGGDIWCRDGHYCPEPTTQLVWTHTCPRNNMH